MTAASVVENGDGIAAVASAKYIPPSKMAGAAGLWRKDAPPAPSVTETAPAPAPVAAPVVANVPEPAAAAAPVAEVQKKFVPRHKRQE